MAELYAGRNVDPEAMYLRMKTLMEAEGLPYGKRTHSYNSRLAQELGKWADTQPGGAALHDALYRAYLAIPTSWWRSPCRWACPRTRRARF
jgi:hypothetical protein